MEKNDVSVKSYLLSISERLKTIKPADHVSANSLEAIKEDVIRLWALIGFGPCPGGPLHTL